MSTEYVKARLAELGVTSRKDDTKERARQMQRRRVYEESIAQSKTCDCCGRDPRASRRGNESLCLDHDHATGAFRGWLCHRCNLGIGLLGDSVEGLNRALAYLSRPVQAPPEPGARLAGMLHSVKQLTPK